MDRERYDQETDDAIWRLHMAGVAPSGIAKALGVDEADARREVVSRWRTDKLMGMRERNEIWS